MKLGTNFGQSTCWKPTTSQNHKNFLKNPRKARGKMLPPVTMHFVKTVTCCYEIAVAS